MWRAVVRGDRCARAANGPIADLKLARRNDRGLVEFSAEFLVLRPADVTRRNGTLLYEVNNRGNIAIFRQLNEAPSNNDPATTADAGNWFLLRHGFTLMWSAWAPASSSLPLRAQDDAGLVGVRDHYREQP